MNKDTILIVEDDRAIAESLGIYLQNQGYQVVTAYDGKEGLDAIAKHEIHLAIVDIMMPNMDGITMTMQLRKEHDFPVIMLSAKSEDVDKVMGLNIGADDYVTKPFQPIELLARVNSQLRRYSKYLSVLNHPVDQTNLYQVGGLELNVKAMELMVEGENVRLTPIEFKILRLLMSEPGRVFSVEDIYQNVWNETLVNTDTIMVHVRNIREKIEVNPKKPRYLKVVWGAGYKIEKQN